MLDPEQIAELKATPGLSFDTTVPGLTENNPFCFAGGKTTGLTVNDLLPGSPESSDDGDFFERTDTEVSQFSFFDRLHHYMEGKCICEENRKLVEVALMVEAGSIVREMGTMTKDRREQAFHTEYMSLVSEIPDERFLGDDVQAQICS
jgi:hypothetical protein